MGNPVKAVHFRIALMPKPVRHCRGLCLVLCSRRKNVETTRESVVAMYPVPWEENTIPVGEVCNFGLENGRPKVLLAFVPGLARLP